MYRYTMFPRDTLANITHINEDGSIHFSDITQAKSPEDFNTFLTESTNHNVQISEVVNESCSYILDENLLNEFDVYVFEMDKKPVERTEEEIREEHLQLNSSLFNNLFFQPEFTRMIKHLQDNRFQYMNFFYPSFRYCNFDMRIASSIGGLYVDMLESTDENGYNVNGWEFDIDNDEEFQNLILTRYSERVNWFFGVQIHDIDHLRYCFKLYDVTKNIIEHKVERIESLEDSEIEILKQWRGRVLDAYRKMTIATKSSYDYYKYCQMLHELMWEPMDDPNDLTICSANVFRFIELYFDDMTINEDSMMRKNDLVKYIFRDSIQSERVFLLPATSQYPIIDKSSVKIAMDNIYRIPESDTEEYSNNLNRRYRELGCRFQIPVNHPYAPYAITGENAIPIVVSHILYDVADNITESATGLSNVNIMKNMYYGNGVE